MTNHQIIQSYIKEHSLPFRTDCPICFNKNTFSASVLNEYIVYNCFHVSCHVKGKYEYGLAIEDILNGAYSNNHSNISNQSQRPTYDRTSEALITVQEFLIPDHWRSPLQNDKCLKFLIRWNILGAYRDGRASIWYDPRLDRCVFILKDKQGRILGATGRNLTFGTQPRWYIYSRLMGCPFIFRGHDKSSNAVLLVEDCVSSIRAGYISDSIALLGTNISDETVQYILDYSSIFIALDPDALHKSFKLQKQLSPYVNTKILSLHNDIKYFTDSELTELKTTIYS